MIDILPWYNASYNQCQVPYYVTNVHDWRQRIRRTFDVFILFYLSLLSNFTPNPTPLPNIAVLANLLLCMYMPQNVSYI